MATHLEVVKQPQIISNGGASTRFVHSGDNSATWGLGQLVKLSSGLITVVQSGAGAIDASADLSSATKLFIATRAVTAATSEKVAVQRITSDTVFWGPLLSSLDGAVPTAPESIIGATYALYQTAAGGFGPNKNVTSDPVVVIVKVQPEYMPHTDSSMYKDSNGDRMNFVGFKFISTVVDNA